MEATLRVLNDAVQGGFVESYAIGGAVGAIFWIEPFDTIDLDVFVYLSADAPPFDPFQKLNEYLKQRGYGFEGEFIVIEGVPVQFLPAEDAKGLRREAVAKAADYLYVDRLMTRVIRPEYLVALALDTHRSKDYERVFKLLSEASYDRALVNDLILRFQLQPFWEVFLRRYPEFT